MDIESFELDALRGASGLMRHHNVWFMIIECNVSSALTPFTCCLLGAAQQAGGILTMHYDSNSVQHAAGRPCMLLPATQLIASFHRSPCSPKTGRDDRRGRKD
jgi:hypothetical protein